MMMADGAFSGWGSALIAGMLSAGTVLLGLWLTQRHERSVRATDAAAEVARMVRAAGNDLMVQVSNVRDAAVDSEKAFTGNFSLWPLRQQLFLTKPILGPYPIHDLSWEFCLAVERFRVIGKEAWKEYNKLGEPQGYWEVHERDIRSLQPSIRDFGDELIDSFQTRLTDDPLDIPGRGKLPDILDQAARAPH